MQRKYSLRLTTEEQAQLKDMITRGETSAYKIRHANVLLKADINGPAWTDKKIAGAFLIHANTVGYIKKRFLEGGIARAVNRKEQAQPSHLPKFDGEAEAKLIAISCSKPPEGRARWTLRMIADRLVTMEIVDSVSPETVRNTLKKTNLNRTCGKNG